MINQMCVLLFSMGTSGYSQNTGENSGIFRQCFERCHSNPHAPDAMLYFLNFGGQRHVMAVVTIPSIYLYLRTVLHNEREVVHTMQPLLLEKTD